MAKQPFTFCAILLLLLSVPVFAQETRPTGLLFEDAVYDQIPRLFVERGVKELPKKVDTLKKHCPTPRDQGAIASCVAWSTVYAWTIMEAFRLGITDQRIIDEMLLSASYIYNQVKLDGDCKSGSKFSYSLNILRDKGVCLAATFPNSTDTCDKLPNEKEKREAWPNRIKAFKRIFRSQASSEDKVEATKEALAINKPVMVGIMVNKEFTSTDGIAYWQPEDNPPPGLGHALVVIGYDKEEKKFELINSYGTGWGCNGFVKIGFEDFGELVKYGFVLMVE